jgi:predicted DNA-binding transcriptional regulator AlpA
MLNKEDLATFLAMSTKVLSNWRWRGSGPRWVKVGRLVRYRREDVLAWIESNRSPAGRDVA